MADTAAVVKGFFDAWTKGDFDGARDLVHDDLSFNGPFESFGDADSYLGSLRQLAQIVTGAETQRVFSDGEEAAVFYELRTQPVPSSQVAEWYRLRDGKIASIIAIFDARPFAPMFEGR